MIVQLLTVYLFEWNLLELPPLNKLHPHSYIILPPQKKLPPHSYTILPHLAGQLLAHFTPLWTKYAFTHTPL